MGTLNAKMPKMPKSQQASQQASKQASPQPCNPIAARSSD